MPRAGSATNLDVAWVALTAAERVLGGAAQVDAVAECSGVEGGVDYDIAARTLLVDAAVLDSAVALRSRWRRRPSTAAERRDLQVLLTGAVRTLGPLGRGDGAARALMLAEAEFREHPSWAVVSHGAAEEAVLMHRDGLHRALGLERVLIDGGPERLHVAASTAMTQLGGAMAAALRTSMREEVRRLAVGGMGHFPLVQLAMRLHRHARLDTLPPRTRDDLLERLCQGLSEGLAAAAATTTADPARAGREAAWDTAARVRQVVDPHRLPDTGEVAVRARRTRPWPDRPELN